MIFSDFQTEVGQGLPSDASDRLALWVNQAVNDFLTRDRWSFLEVASAAVALVNTQAIYQLAGGSPLVTDFAGLIDVRVEVTASGYKQKIKAVTPQTFDMFSGHPATGMPTIYTVVGGALPSAGAANILSGALVNLNVWPTPVNSAGNGVNLFLRYYRNTDSVPMSAGTDKPIVPVAYHQAIVELARATGLEAYNMGNEAGMAQARAEKLIQQAVASDMAYRGGDAEVFELKPLLLSPQQAPLGPADLTQHGAAQAQ